MENVVLREQPLNKYQPEIEKKHKSHICHCSWKKLFGIILLVIIILVLLCYLYKKITRKTITLDLDLPQLGLNNTFSDISPFVRLG